MSTYRLISYDVWGNEKDGYEVNQAFYTDERYTLESDWTNEQVIKALRKQGCLKKYIRTRCIEIDGDDKTMYFNYKGRPEFELRMEE